MNHHSHIKLLLYDYLQNELSPEETQHVEAHLAACGRCSKEAELIKAALHVLPAASEPSEELSPEYWRSFSMAVERRIQLERREKKKFQPSGMNLVLHFLAYRPRYIAVAGSAAVFILALIFFRKPEPRIFSEQELVPPAQTPIEAEQTSDRMHEYFRKSKILLVGLTNMKTEDSQDIDLSAERKVSRELLHEARYLQQQPLDNRSAKLIGDLQKILIELANMKETSDAPDVEILRGGIHQENLLFKIRMEENLFDTSAVIQHYR